MMLQPSTSSSYFSFQTSHYPMTTSFDIQLSVRSVSSSMLDTTIQNFISQINQKHFTDQLGKIDWQELHFHCKTMEPLIYSCLCNYKAAD